MKKTIALFLAAILCLSLAACKKAEPEEGTKELQARETDMGKETEVPESTAHESFELVGPWHLDGEKNDLDAFSDCFPGYGEWGASMELRSDGRMSWYIGAEGWHGTYETDGETLHAELTSDLEPVSRSWDFRIVIEKETALLEMAYPDRTIYWVYGDQEDPAGGTSHA